MAKRKNNNPGKSDSTATAVGYEAQLLQMADALRGSIDAAEYKDVVLGLVFLEYVSEASRERHAKVFVDKEGDEAPKDPDEFRATGTFWIAPEARRGARRGAA